MFELKPIHSNMEKKAVLNEIMTRTEALAKGKVVLHYSGGACLETEIDNLTRIDNNTFIPITFFLIFAVVYGMLRNLPLALLGQLNITVILIWGMGFMILTGETINMVTVIIAPVLLAISIADSIHILSFYNETYRKNGKSHAEAIAHSAKSLWYPCLFTSATTAVGFLSFLTATVRPVRMVGIFTGIGAMLAFVLTIFALPSLIMAFRKPVEWSLSSPSKAPSPIQRPDRFQAILDTLAKTLVKRYVSISLVFLLITIVLSAGMFKLRFETDFVNFLKQTNKIKQDIIYVENHLRGTVAVELIVHAKSPDHDFTHPESLQQLAKAQTEIYQHMSGYFTTSFSAADYIKEINKAFNGGSETAFTIPVNQQDVVDYYELGDMKMLKRVISPDRLIARLSFSSKFGSLE
jgi:predicted RND superfamily exporter protein